VSEVVVVWPVTMLTFLFVLNVGFGLLGREIATAAAQDAARAADGRVLLRNVQIEVRVAGGRVETRVSGRILPLVPGIAPRVSVRGGGPVEEFSP
jgi:hypothetical protein